jgi:hypothetical protein
MRVKRNERAVLEPGDSLPLKADGFSNERSSEALDQQMLEDAFEQLSSAQKLLLARQLGYDSFDNMLAASRAVTLSDGSAWWLTADRNGAWTAWNLCTLGLPLNNPATDGTCAADQK